MQKRWITALAALLLTGTCLVSCSDVSRGNETEHSHEYHLSETVRGTCAAPGYQKYVCSCGESFESAVPTPHSYTTLADVTDSYFMEICRVCGTYSITHEQDYLYYIDFENAKDYEEAALQENSECYRASGEHIGLVADGDDTSLKVTDTNYYILDKSEVVKSGEDFVASMDIRFDKHAKATIFSILCYFEGSKDFSYNAGLIFVEADGRLSSVTDGDLRYYEEVYLSEDGYDNIVVKGSLKTGLYDIYVNEKLVRKNVSYVKTEKPLKMVCLRYFDAQNSATYTAYADNLKLCAATLPEFVIDEDQIDFGK